MLVLRPTEEECCSVVLLQLNGLTEVPSRLLDSFNAELTPTAYEVLRGRDLGKRSRGLIA